MMELPRFLVFGEALTDFVRTGANQWTSAAGGAGWNAARVAATLGVATGWAGAVSDDLFGEEIIAESRKAGLDMRFAQVAHSPPLIAMVHQSDPPRYFFLGEGAADLAFDEGALPAGWESGCEMAYFGGISLVRGGLGERLEAIARRLARRGVRIVFDPNYRNLMDETYPALFERVAAVSAIIKLSDEDLEQIYPDRSVAAALDHVRRLCPDAMLLYTRGEDGMSLLGPGARHDQGCIRVAVADTVGAGDASIGGFVASLLQDSGAAWPQHLRFAAAAAAAACTRGGAHAPARDEVEALLEG